MSCRSVTTGHTRSEDVARRRDATGEVGADAAPPASPRIRPLAALLALAVGAAAVPGEASAQEVVLTGKGDPSIDRRIERLLASGDYVVVARETLITDSVPTTLLVVDATVTLEGAVAGDLVAVDANVFVRPSARIHGDMVNIAGGIYSSALAVVSGETVDRPLATYAVRREVDRLVIEARSEDKALKLHGLFGFDVPTYDRVDALGITWGASYRLPVDWGGEPWVDGSIGYRSGRGAIVGGGALRLVRGPTTFRIGAEEWTETNDRWIRGDLRNSLTYLYKGRDYRNYYEAERVYAAVDRRFGDGDRSLTVGVRGQLEDASSLGAGDHWTILDREVRANPPIDDGRISSLVLGADGEWVGVLAVVEGSLRIELAESILGGDFAFGRIQSEGEWAMKALANHTLEVEWYLQGVLPGTSRLPRQRWSFVGGSGTLKTFDIARFRGDRIVFVESSYIIPLPRRWQIPILGAPDLHLEHAIGMAWTEGVDRDFEQNIGVRLQFFVLSLRAVTDPEDPIGDIEFDVGLSWPSSDAYPWRRR